MIVMLVFFTPCVLAKYKQTFYYMKVNTCTYDGLCMDYALIYIQT